MTLIIEAPEQRLFARSESSRTGIEAVVLCDSLRRVLYDLPDSRSRRAFDTPSRQAPEPACRLRSRLPRFGWCFFFNSLSQVYDILFRDAEFPHVVQECS